MNEQDIEKALQAAKKEMENLGKLDDLSVVYLLTTDGDGRVRVACDCADPSIVPEILRHCADRMESGQGELTDNSEMEH